MSIPIKAQLNAYGEANGWKTFVILCDGSTYGVDGYMVMHEFSRSYMGQVAKQYLKDIERSYHEQMRKANLVENQGDLLDADCVRETAEDYKKANIVPARKFFAVFKSMSTARVRNVPDSRVKPQAKTPKGKLKAPKKCPCHTHGPYVTE